MADKRLKRKATAKTTADLTGVEEKIDGAELDTSDVDTDDDESSESVEGADDQDDTDDVGPAAMVEVEVPRRFPGAPQGTVIGPGEPVRFKGVMQGNNQVRVVETVYQALKPNTSKRYTYSQVLVEGTVIPLDRCREVEEKVTAGATYWERKQSA